MKNGIKTLAMWLIIGVIFIVVLSSIVENNSSNLKYSELVSDINSGKVENIELDSEAKTAVVTLKDDKVKREVNIPSIDDFMSYTEDYLKEGAFTLDQKSESIFIAIISLLTPFGLLIIFFIFWFLMMGGVGNNNAGGKTMTFGKSKAKMMTPADKNRITFDDVAGVDEEKEELEEIVEFLKNPKKFTDMGARIPKGVLLVGQPGTGKTLLAKSSCWRSRCTILYYKVVQTLLRCLLVLEHHVLEIYLNKQRKNAPCIIFIDEIDAVGRQRGAGLGGGHDEREQTLNQLLVEMDGFAANEGVIVLAATNRPDVLDKALLRAGRFDRQIVIGMPDVKSKRANIRSTFKKEKD